MNMARQKEQAGRLGGWVSISVNLLLFLLKAVLGWFTGSLAILADAFHTFSDVATSLVMLLAVRIAHKPGDRLHPFGHERAEPIATILMATILAVAGFEIGKSSLLRIFQPVPLQVADWVIWVILLTILLKEALAQFSFFLARKSGLQLLRVDAWHHRADALSSVLVLFTLLLVRWNIPVVDALAGLMISLLIVYTAYRMARESIDHLLGTPPEPHLLDRIEQVALDVEGVLGVHDVVVHSYGTTRVVSIHIEVDEKLPLVQAHQISEQVARRLREELGVYSTVHVDPVMPRTPEYRRLEKLLNKFKTSHPFISGFHDLRIYQDGQKFRARVDVTLSPDYPLDRAPQVVQLLREFLLKHCQQLEEVEIKVEPHFSISRKSRHDAPIKE